MLNVDKLNHLRADNSKLYHTLLTQISIHSDDSPDLLKAMEQISIQMNNMVEVIEYLMEKEK